MERVTRYSVTAETTASIQNKFQFNDKDQQVFILIMGCAKWRSLLSTIAFFLPCLDCCVEMEESFKIAGRNVHCTIDNIWETK